jgi:hypothetical protein
MTSLPVANVHNPLCPPYLKGEIAKEVPLILRGKGEISNPKHYTRSNIKNSVIVSTREGKTTNVAVGNNTKRSCGSLDPQ